ncbi:hypothetical protein SKAU_G00192570 [Synaphobranchus kaupii]|uniref:ribonuclease H n=1 Tax=Synaphobranchus kaupii TaxID=118154 RepID=A0A9Q1FDS0_SYNKA|nr:hypothetical protein SKAU_G00192570 [Synaphobranchus kaupii]
MPVDPPIPWANWLENFTVYLDALGYEDIPDKRKTALLRHCLGVEGQRIFRTLGLPETYEDAVALLTEHFTGQQRILLRCYKLRKRLQRPGESVRSYVTNLKDMARLCDYGTLQEQIIRDQFIEGILCEKTRERLLLESDNLTLGRTVEIALQVETAVECTTLLAGTRLLAGNPTQQLQPTYHAHYSAHSTDDSQCCSEAGFPVQLAQGQSNRCTSEVRLHLMNSSTYYRFFSHLPLEQPATALCGYDSSRLDILGVLRVPVHYSSKHLPSFPFHIARQGANLLGLDLFTGLGFTLRDDSGSAIHVDSTWRQKWPALFHGLGCLTAFTHRPLQVSAAPWISNLVIAKKKSGGIRICVDLRLVNKAVIPDRYPLPTSEELTALFYGSTVFTKLDLRQGYLQVPLHPASRDLTAFVTHAGVFRYTRMPFGLSSAPSCFQKVMSTILAGIPGVAVFLDDIVVHAPDLETHNKCLQGVAQTLLENNLTLNGEKCCFAAPAIDFVGFRLSAKGIAPLQSNIEAIHRIPEPT